MEESKLVELAKSGDRQALAQLVKNNEQTVYNFSFKICRNRDKAEHIMQETFFSMIKSLHQFDGNSKISTWLYRIVSNHCLMLARKDKSKTFVSIDNDDELYEDKYTADWSNIPNQNIENTELRKILDESIDKLSPEYRIVFLLRDVEGLSTEETAELTELTVPAVKSQIAQSKSIFKKRIKRGI